MTPRKAEVYQSDRGDKYDIATMETSHLVNVLGHHLAQIKTLQILNHQCPYPQLRERINMLGQITKILTDELVKRDVSLQEYLPNGD
jgi:hypothetical protein